MKRPPVRKVVVASSVVLLVASALTFVIMFFGVQMYRINSGSMTGTIPEGALVITYDIDPTQLQPRDIITFHNPEKSGVVTHTYLGTNRDGSLKTKGDANPTPDNFVDHPLQPSGVIGKVGWHIDVFTPVFWQSWRGPSLAVGLLGLIGLFWLLTSDESKKQGKHRRASQPA